MVSVKLARSLIRKNCKSLRPVKMSVTLAEGHILAETVYSPVDLPPFNQSSMDGYAIKFSPHIGPLKITGMSAAGKPITGKLLPGEAARIFTGAVVPAGADTVVMQEKVIAKDNYLIIKDSELIRGMNVRPRGMELRKANVALHKGIKLTPAAIGFLASMGITTIKVIPQPRISIIVTGNELQEPGTVLKPGNIFESNSFSLRAALQSLGLKADHVMFAPDEEPEIFNAIFREIQGSDLVLLTGGISVGDYDLVGKALKRCGVKTVFYKVSQKPGKPLFFGKKKDTLVFALPGNPAAVLTCFYEYVYPLLNHIGGRKEMRRIISLPVSKDLVKKKGLSFFLKAKVSGGRVQPLDGQASFILRSFASANALIYLPQNCENVKAGDLVEVHLLPGTDGV